MDIDTHSLLLHDIQVETNSRYGDFGDSMDRHEFAVVTSGCEGQ